MIAKDIIEYWDKHNACCGNCMKRLCCEVYNRLPDDRWLCLGWQLNPTAPKTFDFVTIWTVDRR